MRKTSYLILMIMTMTFFSGLGAVSYTLSDESVQIGTNVNISWSGLTASTTYKLKDDSGMIVDYFTTGSGETTGISTVTITQSGENHFYLYNSSDILQDTVTVYGQDPFDQLIYSIVPLILAAAIVVTILAFVKRLSR